MRWRCCGVSRLTTTGRAHVLDARSRPSPKKFKETYPHPVDSNSDAMAVVAEVLDFVGRTDLAAACPAYRQGDWMKKVAEAVALHLQVSCAEQAEWGLALMFTRDATRCR
jgi:hypothetical protein